MRLMTLIGGLDGKLVYAGKHAERDIAMLCHDSRGDCKEGLFFCLTGGNTDGHMYAKQAIQKGAVAIVAERELDVSVPQFLVKNTRQALSYMASQYYGNPSEHLKIIGITGTNGKTTTAHMLYSILQHAGKKVGLIGTLGVRYGDRETPSNLTTPDPLVLHRTFAEMFLDGVEYVVMECSAHALHFCKLDGIRFSACIFTNVSQDHLDFFSGMQAYKTAKIALFAPDVCPLAIVNTDDSVGRELLQLREGVEGLQSACYGLSAPSDAFAIVTDEQLEKTECVFNINDELARVSLHFTGLHNVYNALAACVCATSLGFSMKSAVKGLSQLKGVPGRLQRVASYRGAHVFVDYAHTPDGLEKTLNALKNKCMGRLLCLFGCGGNRDKTKRPMMGETAAKQCDFAVLTSDNPRYEDPLDIIADIEKGYRRFSQKYVIIPIRERAIEYALEMLKEGDILLIAGKGGEAYQEIMGIKYVFKDNDIIEKWMERQRNTEMVLY